MPDGKLTWWKVVTATVWTAVAVLASSDTLAQDAPAAESAVEAAERDLQQLRNTLNDPNASQAQRDEAAKRLLSRQTPEAREILRSTLVDVGNRGGQLAVARALAHDPHPDESLVTPLYALMGSDQSLTEAGAQALAAHKNNAQVLTRLQDFARNRNNRTGRVAAIRALGTFVDKRAAQTLIDLLASDDESSAARDAAADALIDMAGLSSNEISEVLELLFKLNASGITVIMIEHIMQAVMKFSQRVVCLDAGRIICEGTPETIVQNPDVQKAYLGA